MKFILIIGTVVMLSGCSHKLGNERVEDRDNRPTPELIESAYDNGVVGEEEKWLYLMYAVYEYQSLPGEYQSDAAWDGTLYINELKEIVKNGKACEFSEDGQQEFERLLSTKVVCGGI